MEKLAGEYPKAEILNKRIIIGIAIAVVITSVVGGAYYYRDKNSTKLRMTNINNEMVSLETLGAIAVNVNDPQGGYFDMPADKANEIIDQIVANNSNIDSAYLFLAGNTAYKLGRLKEAAFLFHAAQVRHTFEKKVFNLGYGNGSDIETYLQFLNETVGQSVNPAITREYAMFVEVNDMIKKWEAAPTHDAMAMYARDGYGDATVDIAQWPALAEATKQSYLEGYANKFVEFARDEKNREMFYFVQDYNFGKIPHDEKNDATYAEYEKVIREIYN